MGVDLSYALIPFACWFVAGGLKFAINSMRSGKLATGQIGYGGFPSNHSAIVSGISVLIALREGIASPAFGIALTVAFIVMMDANSLRRQVGRHAEAINRISNAPEGSGRLRERMGHTGVEIAGGVAVGALVAFAINSL